MTTLVSPGSGPVPGVPSLQPQNLFRFGEITLYSTQGYVGGEALANSTARLFSTALGAPGQGFATQLTKSETNIKVAGQIPAGQAYDVYGVAAQVMGASANLAQIGVPFNDEVAQIATLQNIVSNGVLSWDFTQTVVDICPVMLAGAGGGVYGAIAQNAAGANAGAMNNGNGGIFCYKRNPVALPGQSVFGILMHFGSRAAAIPEGFGVAVRVVLLGYYKNVIEIG